MAKVIPFRSKSAKKKDKSEKEREVRGKKYQKFLERENAWKEYQGLVKWVSSSMSAKCRNFVTTEDLISVGNIGLLKAMEKYDPKKNAQFRTYAVIKIRGEILDYIRKNYPRPVSQQIKAKEYLQAYETLNTKNKRKPTIQEIATELGVSIEEAHEMADMSKQVQFVDWDQMSERSQGGAIDHTILNQTSSSMIATISRNQMREKLSKIMKTMPDKVQEVIYHLYFEDLSQIEVAEHMNLSPSRVSQLHTEGIAMLQETLSNQLLADCLIAA